MSLKGALTGNINVKRPNLMLFGSSGSTSSMPFVTCLASPLDHILPCSLWESINTCELQSDVLTR